MSKVPGWLPSGGRFEESGTEYIFECPSCGQPKFFWNLRKNAGYCFRCDLKVGSSSYLRRLLGQAIPEQEKVVAPEPVTAKRFLEKVPVGGTPAEVYLASRLVPVALADKIGFLYEPETQRIHAPIWSPLKGSPPSYKSRSIVPGQKGWMSRKGDGGGYLFGEAPAGNRMEESVVLVEGVFDVLTPRLWGRALALLGSQLLEGVEWWLARTYRKVILLLDPDEPGMGKAKNIEGRLVRWGIPVDNLTGNYPEPGSCYRGELDFLRKDP